MKPWAEEIGNERLLVRPMFGHPVLLVSLRDRIHDAFLPEGSMSLCQDFGTAAEEKASILTVGHHDRLVGRRATSGPHVCGPASDHSGRVLRILSPSPLAGLPDCTACERIPAMQNDELSEPLHVSSRIDAVPAVRLSAVAKNKRF